MRLELAAATIVTILAVPGALRAATVVVPPGPGTPVQDAIDAAAPGDTIRLMIGSYAEHLVITKSIKLRGARSTSTQSSDITRVEGDCSGGGPIISIAATGVSVRSLATFGDDEGGVDVRNSDHVKLSDLFVASGCDTVTAPGINVEQSAHVKVGKVWTAGTAGAAGHPLGPVGVRLANLVQAANVRLGNSIAGHYAIGVLLENVGGLAARVSTNDVNFNDRGLVLDGTTRASIVHNRLVQNVTSGIEIHAGSSGNSIVGNAISGSTTDVVDDGSGNCWRNDSYTTGSVPACP